MTTQSLPSRTEVLIIGGGPAGLAAAISLKDHGCTDITVVDSVSEGHNSSRAMVVHAATIEVCPNDSDNMSELSIPLRH